MIGESILHYKILEKLGEGGMGEVYKARDTKLDRFVALKFLPSNLTTNEEQKVRFIQEAKTASAMNHPNICTIYSIEEYDNDKGEKQQFIAMEYVEGETLKDKKNSLSEKQKLEISVQVAEGLAAAHEKGIVHRDIKPENIMIRKDGIAQIMDFGLAKLYANKNVSRLTKMGTTVGTLGYMSPEQVQGLDVDHRTDIFSFGVVLYELFAGESPFKGMHETAIMYEIVNVEAPPVSTVKEGIDPELDEIILECLEKDKDERCQSAKELAKDLRKVKKSTGHRKSRVYKTQTFTNVNEDVKAKSGVFDINFKRRIFKNKIPISIISILTIALLIMTFLFLNSSPVVSGKPIHLSMNIKEGLALGPFSSFAISPDGSQIVYTVNQTNARMLYIRDINSYEAKPIPGTEGALSPCFSPDGKWLAFWSDEIMKKTLISGGPVTVIFNTTRVATHPLPYLFWGTDNEIYFSLGIAGGIYRVPSDGGQPEPIANTDENKGQGSYRWPVLLPDGNNLMFTAEAVSGIASSRIMVRSLKNGTTKTIANNAEYANYVKPGYILFIRNNALYASKFDLGDLSLKGSLVPVLTNVTTISQTGQAEFSLSNTGTLLYLPGTTITDDRNLAWVDHSGRILKSTDLHQPIEDFDISPDGKKVAVTIEGAAWNIWIYDIERNTLSPLTYGTDARDPKWTPDGKTILFDSFQDGSYGLFSLLLDNSAKEKRLMKSNYFVAPYSVSPDGKYVAYAQGDSVNNMNIGLKELEGNAPPKLITAAPFYQEFPMFSSNGKYMAYASDESGKKEVYVISLNGAGSKIPISTNGGDSPFWSRDSKYLYYYEFQGKKLMQVPVNFSSGFSAGSPKEVFSIPIWDNTIRPFEEIPGTQNFMILKAEDSGNSRNSLNVILNWNEELKNKLANAN
jgi:serine/threonine protein kinase